MEAQTMERPRNAAATRARFKHGMYSQQCVIPGEDPAEFDKMHAGLVEDLRPEGTLEAKLVLQIANRQCVMERLWSGETGVYQEFGERCSRPDVQDMPQTQRIAAARTWDAGYSNDLDRGSRHTMRVCNQFHKALKTLAVVRDLRKKGLLPALAEQEITPSSESASRNNADRGDVTLEVPVAPPAMLPDEAAPAVAAEPVVASVAAADPVAAAMPSAHAVQVAPTHRPAAPHTYTAAQTPQRPWRPHQPDAEWQAELEREEARDDAIRSLVEPGWDEDAA